MPLAVSAEDPQDLDEKKGRREKAAGLVFLAGARVGVRRREDCRTLRITGAGTRIVNFFEGFAIVFGEALESGLGMLVHGAHGGNQAGVKKRFHTLAELIGGAFRGVSDFRFQGLAARLASGAVLGIERGKS